MTTEPQPPESSRPRHDAATMDSAAAAFLWIAVEAAGAVAVAVIAAVATARLRRSHRLRLC